MQADLECHSYDEATKSRCSIVPKHRDKEELYTDDSLQAFDSCRRRQSPLHAVDRGCERFEYKYLRDRLHIWPMRRLTAVGKRYRQDSPDHNQIERMDDICDSPQG